MAMWASTGTNEQKWEEGVWYRSDCGTTRILVHAGGMHGGMHGGMVAPATWSLYGQVDVELW